MDRFFETLIWHFDINVIAFSMANSSACFEKCLNRLFAAYASQ